ncbi:MAG: hypothetical protein ACLVCH_07735 [Roseburia inulinivorans]
MRYRTYIMTDSESVVLMEAHPAYAKEDDPDVVGWSICRVPKVDHADILICGTKISFDYAQQSKLLSKTNRKIRNYKSCTVESQADGQWMPMSVFHQKFWWSLYFLSLHGAGK